jgi:hypothetical protein
LHGSAGVLHLGVVVEPAADVDATLSRSANMILGGRGLPMSALKFFALFLLRREREGRARSEFAV